MSKRINNKKSKPRRAGAQHRTKQRCAPRNGNHPWADWYPAYVRRVQLAAQNRARLRRQAAIG